MRLEIISILACASLAVGQSYKGSKGGIGLDSSIGSSGFGKGAGHGLGGDIISSKTVGSSIRGSGFSKGSGLGSSIGVSGFDKGHGVGFEASGVDVSSGIKGKIAQLKAVHNSGFTSGHGSSDLGLGHGVSGYAHESAGVISGHADSSLGLGHASSGLGLGHGSAGLGLGHGESTLGLGHASSGLALEHGSSGLGFDHGISSHGLGHGSSIGFGSSGLGLDHGISSHGLGHGSSFGFGSSGFGLDHGISSHGLGHGSSISFGSAGLGLGHGLSSIGHGISSVSSKGLIPHGYASQFGGGLGSEVHGLGAGVGAVGGLSNLHLDDCPHGLERTIYGNCVEPRVSKDLFLYKAPDYKLRQRKAHYDHKPQVHYNLLFIRAPGIKGGPLKPLVVPPPKQKTLVYLLSRRPEGLNQEVIEVPSRPTKPEVFFVNYGEGENPTLPGGIDLRTALTQSRGIEGASLGLDGHGLGGGFSGGHGIHGGGDILVDDVGIHGSTFGAGSLGLKGSSIGSVGLGNSFGHSEVVTSKGYSGSSLGGLGGGLIDSGLNSFKGGFESSLGHGSSGGLKHEFVDSIKGGFDSGASFKGAGVHGSVGFDSSQSHGFGGSKTHFSTSGSDGFVPSQRIVLNSPHSKFGH